MRRPDHRGFDPGCSTRLGPIPSVAGTERFTVYALDTTLDMDPSATEADLEDAIDGHVLDQDALEGTYASWASVRRTRGTPSVRTDDVQRR